jgi:glycosyltransferase involved in cell wall biosynthesis
MSKLRVLHVYRTYFPDPPGGLQEAIRQIALASQLYCIESRIFTLTPKRGIYEIERPEGVVIRSRSWAAPASCDLGGLQSFVRFAEAADWADVINYHFPWPFADILRFVVRPKSKSVLTYHSDIVRQRWLGKMYSPLMNNMLRSVSAVVATSPAYATTSPVLAQAGVREKVRVIPLGITEELYPPTGDETVFARLGISPGEPYFLFVGVLRYYKGLHTLVRSAPQVNAKLVLAGSGPEGDSLKQMAHDLGAENVLFAGQVTDAEKVALIKHSIAMVLPSHLRSEAFGMVLVEAAMLGRPMVSCEIGTGTSYVNLNGESGLVIPPEEPQALVDSLCTLLSDPGLATKLGQGARARYERLFSGPALGLAYSNLYQDVVRT